MRWYGARLLTSLALGFLVLTLLVPWSGGGEHSTRAMWDRFEDPEHDTGGREAHYYWASADTMENQDWLRLLVVAHVASLFLGIWAVIVTGLAAESSTPTTAVRAGALAPLSIVTTFVAFTVGLDGFGPGPASLLMAGGLMAAGTAVARRDLLTTRASLGAPA